MKRLLPPLLTVVPTAGLVTAYLATSDPRNVSFFFLLLLFLTATVWFCCRVRYGRVPFWKGRVRRMGRFLWATGGSLYLLGSLLLLGFGWTRTEGTADCLLVLGAGLRESIPTQVLVNRLERAHRFLLAHPATTAILCGGRGPGETVSEAAAMRAWLLARGIADKRLLPEERSMSTRENLENARRILRAHGLDRGRIAVVSSEFHLLRIRLLARGLGMEPLLLAAPSPWYLLPGFLFREILAVGQAILSGN